MGRHRLLVLSLTLALFAAGCTVADIGQRNPGSAAEDLVSTSRYDNLLVEIDHPPGHAPTQEALTRLREALNEVTQKKGIEIQLDASVPAEKRAYTYEEIAQLEDTHRDHRSSGETAVLYVIYVAGTSAKNDNTLGATYRGTSIVMFEGKISQVASGLFAPSKQNIERAVLIHEYGHAAGLINLEPDMNHPREDPEHPGHSSDKGSVMYWAVENGDGILNLFTGGSSIPYQFSADDKAALRAMWA